MVHILGKDFFAAANFKGLWDVSFQTESKSLQYALVCMSSVAACFGLFGHF